MKYVQKSNDKHGLILFLLCVFMALMASCSNDDTKPIEESQSNLIGKWYYESVSVNGERFEYDNEMFNDCPVPKEEYIEFKEDGFLITFYYSGCEDDFESVEYILNDDIITVDLGDESRVAEIKELTFTSLVFQYEFDRDDDGELDVIIESYER